MMGGKSTKVSPVKNDNEDHFKIPSSAQDSLDNSQIFVSSSFVDGGSLQREESSDSSAGRGGKGLASRPESQRSKKRPISTQMSRYGGKVGLNQGQSSRTTSRNSNVHRAKFVERGGFQPRRVDPFTATELANSFRSNFPTSATSTTRQTSLPDPNPCEQGSFDDSMSYLLKINVDKSVTTCPSCSVQYSAVVHVPYLLLCGHSFCSQCIEHALKHDPHSLKCGFCFITTPVEPQSRAEDFVKNEAIIDLIDSREFATAVTFQFDRCAECERKTAVVFCSECSASYCDSCNQQQHTGSKVRARHKPVSINLKPRPQPTCKKHPGQSCVLYCETERQPMCVLCKFYGQHKFHNYQILNNSATSYRHMLLTKLEEVNKIEERLSEVAHVQADMKTDIQNKAKESQGKLEKHFADTRNEVLATLEHREATLLTLLDKQVEIKELILEEQRMELAFARSRAIATKEEVTKFLDLNPVSALLSRKHLDNSLETTLKQTTLFPSVGEETTDNHVQHLPVGLRPKGELTSKLQQVLNQHGVVLQLPERLLIVEVKVHSKSISIHWEMPEQNFEVTADRTRTFLLHCFTDVPFKFKKDRIQNFNRHLLSINNNSSSPGLASYADSGYQEGTSMSDTTSQTSSGRLPVIPVQLRTSSNHNVSLVTSQTPLASTVVVEETNVDSKPNTPNLMMLPTSPLKPQSVKLAQSTAAARASGALLKLPALLTKTTEDIDQPTTSLHSDSDSESSQAPFIGTNKGGQQQHSLGNHLTLPLPTNNFSQHSSQTSSSSSSNTTLSIDGPSGPISPNNNMGTNIGSCHKGYAFEEIYSGPESHFTYSGIIAGATYYFRVRCRNAIGEGPWSDTYRCKIPTGNTKT